MKYIFAIVVVLNFCSGNADAQNVQSLDQYLEEASANSPLLKDYQNQASIAQMENKKVKANYRIPGLYTTANWMESPLINKVGYDEAITNGGLYSAVIGAQLPLLTGNFVNTEQQQNNLQQQYAFWNQRTSWRDLKMQITEGYLLCLTDQDNIQNISEQKHLLERQIKIAATLAQTGDLKGTDVLLLQIEIQKLTTMGANWQSQLLNDQAALNKLCGIVDTSAVQFALPPLSITDSVIVSSQYQLQFALDSMNARNQMDLFNLKYKPHLSAYADAGLNATSPSNLQNYFGFSIGLNFSMNLFDGNQKQVVRDQTDLKLNTISSYQKQFKNQRQQNLLNLKKQVELADKRMTQINKELSDYDKLIVVYQQELAQGDISVNDYLVTLRTYIQEKQNLIDQQKQKYSAINAYNYWNW